MNSPEPCSGLESRHRLGAVLVWAVWAATTVAALGYIHHVARNIPYMDDFALVPVMTGSQPVSLTWLWSFHNEHRPVVSRLILVGLYRFIAPDFRVGLYFNALVLSAAAASLLVLVRRLRGYWSWVDIALPLSLLSMGQAETLLIAFAMNLMLSSWIACELIGLAAAPGSRLGWQLVLKLGFLLLLLPLCGGSGLVMLPPLVLWLACYSIWGRAPGPDPDLAQVRAVRAAGIGFSIACVVLAGCYMWGYAMPPNHRPPPSFEAVRSTTLEYLSLVVWPSMRGHWRLAGWGVAFFTAATLARLLWVGLRQTDERPRALAIAAIVLAMLAAALAVGVTRSFLWPGGGRASRYVTTTAPFFCTLFVAWMVGGSPRVRRFVQVALAVLVMVAVPANIRLGLRMGDDRRSAYRRIEWSIRAHKSASQVARTACPTLHPRREELEASFKMLKQAHIGPFGELGEEASIAEAEELQRAIR